jgi:acyl-CoA thioesterase II
VNQFNEFIETSLFNRYAGLFLGPASTKKPLQYHVTSLRDTRSFSTRFIIASQESSGTTRKCFSITIDFTRKAASSGPPHGEPRLPLSYSVSPFQSHPPPDELLEIFEAGDEKLKAGKVTRRQHQALRGTFSLLGKVAVCKNVKGSIFDETMLGIDAKSDTHQQQANPDVTQRRNADYLRAREILVPIIATTDSLAMSSYAIQASFIGFMLDAALAFYPLSQQGLRLIDAGACSTLDFALRFHEDEYDLQEYHLREMRSYCANRDRTFSEALLWDKEGKLIASMSQQCVLRSKQSSIKAVSNL